MKRAFAAALVALACSGEPAAVPREAPVTPQAAVAISNAAPSTPTRSETFAMVLLLGGRWPMTSALPMPRSTRAILSGLRLAVPAIRCHQAASATRI